MQNELNALQVMRKWNHTAEQIVAFKEQDFLTLAITVQEMPLIHIHDLQNADDLRHEIIFRGYILEQNILNDKPLSIGYMRCFVHYCNNGDCMLPDYLYICDFSLNESDRGKGYGSLIMKCVQDYAHENKLEYIRGWLSENDLTERTAAANDRD